MIEFSPRLSDLRISEGGLRVKEPEVGVVGPKLWKFNGYLGNKLGGVCCFLGHDVLVNHERICPKISHFNVKVGEKSRYWLAFFRYHCMFKVGVTNIEDARSVSNETQV